MSPWAQCHSEQLPSSQVVASTCTAPMQYAALQKGLHRVASTCRALMPLATCAEQSRGYASQCHFKQLPPNGAVN